MTYGSAPWSADDRKLNNWGGGRGVYIQDAGWPPSRIDDRASMKADDATLVLSAASMAACWHASQRRKGGAGEPYIKHLLEVASLVGQATGGNDTNLIIAALLHDAIEDQGVTRATIAEQYGDDVASLVEEVTDDKSLPKATRKRLQVEHAPDKSPRAKILKLADKINNVTAIGKDPPADWPIERQRDYIQWGRDVVAGLRGASPELEAQLDQAADDAECLITVNSDQAERTAAIRSSIMPIDAFRSKRTATDHIDADRDHHDREPVCR